MQDLLNKLSKAFLCGVSINDLALERLNIQDFSLENQEILINKTINSELILQYPLKTDYQKAFIRYFVQKLEKENCEVHEKFYTDYGRLVSNGEDKVEYFKHYLVGSTGKIISLKENINLISEGTTGLRTWQASLALAEWALKNKEFFIQKRILELGSGIGLTGLTISLECDPKHVYLSDCHPSVLQTLCGNIVFNTKENPDDLDEPVKIELDNTVVFNKEQKSGVNISVLNLPWEDVDHSVAEKINNIDLVLAADVVYDSDLFCSLIQALTCISNSCNVQDIVFACTERNPDTLKEFLDQMGENFKVEEENCPNQENFVWCADPPVRMFKFHHN